MNTASRAMRVIVAASAVVALLTGCAASSPPRQAATTTNRMDSTEFRRPEFRTVYDAIKARHPDWLVARGGPTSIANASHQTPVIGVFFEGESRGYPLDKLTELVGGDVRSIRRISSSESLGTYGPDWPWGGVVITRSSIR